MDLFFFFYSGIYSLNVMRSKKNCDVFLERPDVLVACKLIKKKLILFFHPLIVCSCLDLKIFKMNLFYGKRLKILHQFYVWIHLVCQKNKLFTEKCFLRYRCVSKLTCYNLVHFAIILIWNNINTHVSSIWFKNIHSFVILKQKHH